MEIKQVYTTIQVDGKDEKFLLLKYIQDECKEFIDQIRGGKKKELEDFQKMVAQIETCSELNFYFLKYLKDNQISYEKDGENWDYASNLKMLKETLTNTHYNLLEDKNKESPLNEIISILKEYVTIGQLGTKKERNNMYTELVKKYPISFTKLNFPLVTGIERLRMKYYRDLIIEKNISLNCFSLNSYITIMEQDKEICNNSEDDYIFNSKLYLLILTLTQTFDANNEDLICNYFTKNLNNDDKNGIYKNIKLLKEGEYLVETKLEKKTINEKDYIFIGLQRDISTYPYYPLEILLLRNESYSKFEKDGGKGFIYNLGLYDSFISYIKYFIKSKIMKQELGNKDCYKNFEILLSNDDYISEMLDYNHFRFLPLYGSKKTFGYTNKDLLISFINSIPEIAENIKIGGEDVNKKRYGEDNGKNVGKEEGKIEERGKIQIPRKIQETVKIRKEGKKEEDGEELDDNIQNLTNLGLLLSIGVKFITSIHELVIHFINAYLHYFSNKKLDSSYYKVAKDDDGGFSFEKQLNGGKRLEYLNINSIIVLLDGVSCQKDLSDFQKDLNGKLDIEDFKKRIEEGKIGGFLKDFLEKYPINFDYFRDNQNEPQISCRRLSDIGIYMNRSGPDSYGGGRAVKK